MGKDSRSTKIMLIKKECTANVSYKIKSVPFSWTIILLVSDNVTKGRNIYTLSVAFDFNIYFKPGLYVGLIILAFCCCVCDRSLLEAL